MAKKDVRKFKGEVLIYGKDLYDRFTKRGYGEDNNYVQSGVLPAEDGEAGSGCGF